MKYYILIILFCITTYSFSQEYDYPDNSDTEVGFNFGFNYNMLRINSNLPFDTIDNIMTKSSTGFNISMVFHFNIAKNFSIRTSPGLNFYKNEIDFNFLPKGGHTEKLNLSFVPFPIQLNIYPSQNKKLYVLLGAKYSIMLGNSDRNTEHILELRKNDLCFETGFGIDIKGNSIIFAPEIKYSYSIININKPSENIYNKSLISLYFHTLTFSFNII